LKLLVVKNKIALKSLATLNKNGLDKLNEYIKGAKSVYLHKHKSVQTQLNS